ncbi:glutamate ABC transporter substrate-binding protein [Psychromicrobium lacuslunae]|uniref:ABC transporter substrate-binding protein n=1 Tax=Psychromicrobium lacuslunae TaxID=1618207 RepID=A0A0D4BZJ8_9MICC|nr:glutamate ABC transporter substrate-binding protein [Psychromicrobium lacuslunae]AJT41560.1 ABC transporter substrate-binding protein [Psychromicrobium lacuslunae]
MRFTKKAGVFGATALAAALALTACGQSGSPNGGNASAGPSPEYKVASDVKLDSSPTWTKANKAGKLVIGVKFDQPGLGNKKAGADKPEGFDIEIAKSVAAGLGFKPEQIEFKETVSKNREPFLQNGTVDLVVATYTINDARKKVVDFAGPYYIAGQDLLVKKDSTITGPDDLKGKKVCSVDGSTPAQRITEKYPDAQLVTYDTYSKCVDNLNSGSVDAVTTDDAILRGYAAQSSGALKVVGKPFSQEPYGIGLAKGDTALRTAINDSLEKLESDGTWKKAFEYTLGSSEGITIPKPDRY